MMYMFAAGGTETFVRSFVFQVFFKAIRDNELETVQRLVTFFRNNNAFLNCREQQTGNGPLHVACRAGHYVSETWFVFEILLVTRIGIVSDQTNQ